MKKSVIAVLSAVGGAVLASIGVGKNLNEKLKYQNNMSNKHLSLYLMMNQWVNVKQENKSITEYLEKNGYREIAIYGMNYVGETLVKELENSNVKIKYGVDQNAENIYMDVDILKPDDDLPQVDAIIVTAITFFEGIAESLSQKVDCPILSMEDILYEV